MPSKKMTGILLLSGGFDSPVAGKLLEKEVELIGLHFSHQPFADSGTIEKVKELAPKIHLKKLYVIKAGKLFSRLSEKCDQHFYFVLMKRFMLRVGEEFAKKEGAEFLVTGENLGQVSSQTLSNLATITQAIQIPIVRPLLGKDKEEIIHLAHAFQTYEISKGKEMCDMFAEAHPATKSSEAQILEEQKRLNWEEMIQTALKEIEEIPIKN